MGAPSQACNLPHRGIFIRNSPQNSARGGERWPPAPSASAPARWPAGPHRRLGIRCQPVVQCLRASGPHNIFVRIVSASLGVGLGHKIIAATHEIPRRDISAGEMIIELPLERKRKQNRNNNGEFPYWGRMQSWEDFMDMCQERHCVSCDGNDDWALWQQRCHTRESKVKLKCLRCDVVGCQDLRTFVSLKRRFACFCVGGLKWASPDGFARFQSLLKRTRFLCSLDEEEFLSRKPQAQTKVDLVCAVCDVPQLFGCMTLQMGTAPRANATHGGIQSLGASASLRLRPRLDLLSPDGHCRQTNGRSARS